VESILFAKSAKKEREKGWGTLGLLLLSFVTFGLMDGAENSGRGIPRDILNAEAASPPFGQFPAVPVKTMISVSNVSMRYGAKVLFDEVSTGFTPGKRLWFDWAERRRQVHFHEPSDGELEPQKGTVVRPKKLGV